MPDPNNALIRANTLPTTTTTTPNAAPPVPPAAPRTLYLPRRSTAPAPLSVTMALATLSQPQSNTQPQSHQPQNDPPPPHKAPRPLEQIYPPQTPLPALIMSAPAPVPFGALWVPFSAAIPTAWGPGGADLSRPVGEKERDADGAMKDVDVVIKNADMAMDDDKTKEHPRMRRLVAALDTYKDEVIAGIIGVFDRERLRVQRAVLENTAAAGVTLTASSPVAPPRPDPMALHMQENTVILAAVRASRTSETRPLGEVPHPALVMAQYGRVSGVVESVENEVEWLVGVLEWAVMVVTGFKAGSEATRETYKEALREDLLEEAKRP